MELKLKQPVKTTFNINLFESYLNFVDKQNENKLYWYGGVLVLIPGVYMTLSVIAMIFLTEHHPYFIGLAFFVFYLNVTTHIIGANARIFVPMFCLTTLMFIVVPLFTYLVG